VLVLDQFEQWLHSNVRGAGSDLVRGLRHCDGVNLQVLLVVREEFWVTTGRFGSWLDVTFHEGRNAMLLDLFPVEHARQVLERFGRSLGQLGNPLSREDEEFLSGATGVLDRGGLVSPIELSMLVEVMSARRWRTAELSALGGIRGAGLELLERHVLRPRSGLDGGRFRSVAEAVLGSLLPEGRTEIRGVRRSRGELLAAACSVSSTEGSVHLFSELMEQLTGQLRWVRLSMPVEVAGELNEQAEAEPGYELAHDYLVPLLREWLSRSLRGSESGRARLLLEERSQEWSRAGHPDRLLLAPREYVWIRRHVSRGSWSADQTTMMDRVRERLWRQLRILVSVVCLCWLGVWGVMRVVEEDLREREAKRLVEGVCGARLENLGEWVDRLLPFEKEFGRLADSIVGLNAAARLNLALVMQRLGSLGPEDLEYLHASLAGLKLEEVLNLKRAGFLRGSELGERWRLLAEDESGSARERLRAACLWLACREDDGVRLSEGLVKSLVTELGGLGASDLTAARSLLAGVRHQLTGALQNAFEDSVGDSQRQSNLAVFLSEYAADNPEVLGSALLSACVNADRELSPVFARHGDAAVLWMRSALEVSPWQLQKSSGVVSGVLVSELERVCNELRAAGRRPERIRPVLRPFVEGQGGNPGAISLDIVWKNDAAPWEFLVGCEEAELRGESGDWTRGGRCLREAVCLGESVTGERRYLAVWGGADKEDRCCLAGLTETEFEAAAAALRGRNEYRTLRTLSVMADSRGEFRYTGVFAKIGPKSEWRLRWNGVERYDWPQSDVSLAIGSGGELRLAGVWIQQPLLESRLVRNVMPGEAADRTVESAASGWNVAGIAGGKSGEEGPIDGGGVTLLMHRWAIEESQLRRAAEQRAAASLKLLSFGNRDDFRRVLSAIGDRRVAAEVLARLIPYGISADVLNELWQESGLGLGESGDVPGGEFVILAVGEFAAELRRTGGERKWLARLLSIYERNPDPGLHGAAEWALRELGYRKELEVVKNRLATGRAEGGRRWYLEKSAESGEAISMVVLGGPHEFLMGSPLWEWERSGGLDGTNELRHLRRIPRSFAIATTELTVAQYRAFRAGYGRETSGELLDDHPVTSLTWYECAEYCNWLSERAGIPRDQWCYDPDGRFEDGMRMLPDALERTGYRLPTDAEWEYACRAGTRTARYWGDDKALLGRYARCADDAEGESVLPVGSLRPNGYGLFDMLGNVGEWCDGRISSVEDVFGGIQVDLSQGGVVRSDEPWGRVVRGGHFYSWGSLVRSSDRLSERADRAYEGQGFRIARTIQQ